MRWRRESALDVCTGTFGLFVFVSPWLFAYASEVARIDVWATGAAIATLVPGGASENQDSAAHPAASRNCDQEVERFC